MSILIADSGSTKTDWVLLDNNKVVVQCQTIGFSPYFQTAEDIYSEISKNLIPLLKEHKTTISDIVYYGTGCSTPDKIKVIEHALHLSFGDITLNVNHDLLASARALCGKEKGIACILGTGSNSCLYDGETILENVPSLGFMFGDYGSGANIGKAFIQHYFEGTLPKHLHEAFEKAGYNREVILENVYKKPMPNKYLASVLSFIRNYNNDAFIEELIKSCFSDFLIRKFLSIHLLNHYPYILWVL